MIDLNEILKEEPKHYSKGHYVRKKKYKGKFRQGPVENIRKWRGGPSGHGVKHFRSILKIYHNPEYKEFNRGSHKEYDNIWYWDEAEYRCVQRSWKSQSKRRHQWKGDV